MKGMIPILIFLLGTAGTLLYALRLPQSYVSSASIRLSTGSTDSELRDRLLTESKRLLEMPVMEQAARELYRIDADSGGKEIQSQIEGLRGLFQIEVDFESQLIRLHAQGSNPVEVTEAANTVLRTYEAFSRQEKKSEYEKLLNVLNQKIEAKKKEIQEREENIVAIKKRGIVLGMAERLEGDLERLKNKKEKNTEGWKETSAEMKDLTEQIGSFEERIAEIRILEEKIHDFQTDLESLKAGHLALLDQQQELQMTQAETAGDAVVHQYARVPQKPLGVDRNFLILGGMAGSAGLALVLFALLRKKKGRV